MTEQGSENNGVRVEIADGIARITLDRPSRANARARPSGSGA